MSVANPNELALRLARAPITIYEDCRIRTTLTTAAVRLYSISPLTLTRRFALQEVEDAKR